MVGAGISVSAGIPDFRSPENGLYNNLKKYNITGLSRPEDLFDRSFFSDNPQPFYNFAKHILPGTAKPTLTHKFLKKLCDTGMVKRIYTQNIDGLEEMAGINPDLIVQAHGSFKTAKCILGCETMEFSKMKDYIVNSKVPYCKKCKRPIKPEITFFGERLPERFKKFSEDDFDNVDLVLVIGTSLSVNPFRDLIINYPTPQVPRILFNTSNVELPSDIVWQMFVCGESDKICEYVANKLGIVL